MSQTNARRFPPPWSIEETGACYIVRDRDGQALAYVYYEEEPRTANCGEYRQAACAPEPRSIGNVGKLERLVNRPARILPLSAATAPDRYIVPVEPGPGSLGGAHPLINQ